MKSTKPQRQKPMTVRIANWSARHRWPVVVAWFAMVAALTLGGTAGLGTKTVGFSSTGLPVTESGKAHSSFIEAGAIEPDTFILLFNHPTLKTSDPAYRAAVEDAARQLKAVTYKEGGEVRPVFTVVMDFYSTQNPALVSADGTTARIVAPIVGSIEQADVKYKEIKPVARKIKQQYPEFTIYQHSWSGAQEEFEEVISHDLDGSIAITMPLTFLILLVAFGAVVAAIVPLVLAISTLMATFGMLAIYSHVFNPVDSSASQVVVLIGLAVGVDYSLFMITRYRGERRKGRTKMAAIEVASSTAGRAVFFSGVTVMISLAGLFMVNDITFSSIATGTIMVVLVSVIGSLTFLPALLAIIGNGINWGRLPYFGREREEGTGLWSHIVHGVMRRPLVNAIVVSGLLVVLSLPLLHLNLGNTTSDVKTLPVGMEFRDASLLMQQKWTQGTTFTLEVVVKADAAQRQDVKTAVERYNTEAAKLTGLNGPALVTVAPDGKVIKTTFLLSGESNSQANRQLVNKVRQELVPANFKQLAGVEVYVAGWTAVVVDLVEHYTKALPLVFTFVLSLSFLLLLVAFHSIVIPVKAIILNLLSTGAAYGAVILVFQDGYFSEQIGFTPGGVIEAFVPAFLFTILFGLSMDYHLFVLTRIKEERDRGATSVDSVAKGISVTSGTITSAAAIMVVVFAVFVTLRLMIVRQLGLGLAVAVLIDATLIRCILLPATMKLLGDLNWYMPRFLAWVPQIAIESEPYKEQTVQGVADEEKKEMAAV